MTIKADCDECEYRRGEICVCLPVATTVGSVKVNAALAWCNLRFFKRKEEVWTKRTTQPGIRRR